MAPVNSASSSRSASGVSGVRHHHHSSRRHGHSSRRLSSSLSLFSPKEKTSSLQASFPGNRGAHSCFSHYGFGNSRGSQLRSLGAFSISGSFQAHVSSRSRGVVVCPASATTAIPSPDDSIPPPDDAQIGLAPDEEKETATAVTAFLMEVLGDKRGRAAARRHPAVLRQRATRVRETWRNLVDVLGSEEEAAICLNRATSILQSDPSTVAAAMPTLIEELGEADARRVVRGNPELLKSRANTISSTIPTLIQCYPHLYPGGRSEARKLVVRIPALLMTRDRTIAESGPALERIFGRDVTVRLVQNTPHLLMTRADTIVNAAQAVIEVLGYDNAKKVLLKSPYLLMSSESTIRSGIPQLTEIFGAEAAKELALARPYLLKTNGRNIVAMYQVLNDIFGSEKALEMVKKTPSLLRARPQTVRESAPVLQALLGDDVFAQRMDSTASSLLGIRADTIQDSFKTLSEIYGSSARAMDAVRRQPMTLKARATTMRDTVNTLGILLGQVRAREILIDSPTVLQVRAWKLKRNFKYCSDRFGVESARRLPVFYWKASMVTLKRACDRKEESGVM